MSRRALLTAAVLDFLKGSALLALVVLGWRGSSGTIETCGRWDTGSPVVMSAVLALLVTGMVIGLRRLAWARRRFQAALW